MRHSDNPGASQYLVTLLTVAAAGAFRLALEPVVGSQYPFITFFPAVAVVGRYAGFQLAVASVFVSSFLAAILFYDRPLLLTGPALADLIGLALFIALGFFIAWLTKQEREAKDSAMRSLAELGSSEAFPRNEPRSWSLRTTAFWCSGLMARLSFGTAGRKRCMATLQSRPAEWLHTSY
jgi:K+-sensing histidine kinase KdpD